MRVSPRQMVLKKAPDVLADQPRRGIKCHGYGAITPSTGFLSPIHRAEAP